MRCLLFTLIVCVATLVAFPKGVLGQSLESIHRMTENIDGHQLHYLLQEPKLADKKPKDGWPLLLFLHGYGECGDDIQKVKVHGPPKLTKKFDALANCVIVSPQCPKESWWQVRPLRRLVEEVIENRDDIDRERIYISGLSMGAYGTWSLLSHYPDYFAAAIPICGGGNPFHLPQNDPKKRIGVVNEFKPEGLKQVRIPIWAFHGAKDHGVPIVETTQLIDLMKQAGHTDVRMTEYPQAGHIQAWRNAYNQPKTWDWLFAK